jgi:lysozyme family protein
MMSHPQASISPDDHDFSIAMKWLMSIEGGYVNDPTDRGGETKYGISKRQYPDIDIKNLSAAAAAKIYKHDYWDRFSCGKLPLPVGIYLLDCVVNHRASTGIRLLQQSIGATADGIIGPQTIKKTLQTDQNLVIQQMNIKRTRLYFDIVKARSEQAKFLDGWISRLFLLTSFIHGKKLIEA